MIHDKKHLQVLFYLLFLRYAFSEATVIANGSQAERVANNYFMEISALGYSKHAWPAAKTDSQQAKQFSEGIRKFTENQLSPYSFSVNTETGEWFSHAIAPENLTQSSQELSNFVTETKNKATLQKDGDLTNYLVEMPICNRMFWEETRKLQDVANLTVNAVGTEWIILSWDHPCKNAENVSILYILEICESENCKYKNERSMQHNFTDLEPCTQYTFMVKAVVDRWESDGVNIKAITSYNIREIGDVEDLSVANVETDSIYLIWNKPVIHSNCVRNYTIIQCIGIFCKEFKVADNRYTAKHLRPCTEYFFTVKAVTDVVESAGVNKTGQTTSPKPSKPRLVTVEPGSFFLNIHWHPPEEGTACIKHYRITMSPNVTTNITMGTNITMYNLHACTTYMIYINAVTKDNNDGDMTTVKGVTSPTATISPVLHTEPNISVNSISLVWSIDIGNNNCSIQSVTTICNYTISYGHGYEFVNGESTEELDLNGIFTNPVIVNTTVEQLSPYTTYECSAYTINVGGESELSNPVNVTTLEDVPSAPILVVTNITESEFIFSWNTPEYLAGNLTEFEIILKSNISYLIPDSCIEESSADEKVINVNGSTFNYEYLKGKPFHDYTAQIRAKTIAGWGNYSIPLEFRTKQSVATAVSNLSCTIQETMDESMLVNIVLTWGLPCSLNGEIDFFNVSVYGIRKNYTPHVFSIKQNISDIDKNTIFSLQLQEMRGEYNYTFEVSTKIIGVSEFGESSKCSNIVYPADIPPQPDDEYVKAITIDPYRTIRSTSTASVLLPLFSNINGDIHYYAIMVAEMGYNSREHVRYDLKNKPWPNASSWEEAMLNDFSIPYQATRPYWDPYPNHVADYGHMKAVRYILGEDTTCKEISSNTDKRLYCNGPLKPDTWYHVRMRAFTYGGYSDSTVFLIKTDAELNIAIVIGIVFGILFLGILTTMMLLVRKCSLQAIVRRFLHSDMTGSPVPAPFTRKKFIVHCQQLADNPGKLSNEFRLLQTLSVDIQMPTNTACLQANKKKNRYSDILPYDFSRVKLEIIDNDPNTDYINASFIKGYSGEDEYIASQGPKEETTYDFWRMIDQYDVNIIVMLTQLVEKGKEKCHQYFPTIRETFRYENMTIKCISELDFRTYTQRTLVLQKNNKKRNIIHLHFKDWPDHDVPEDFDPMIHFCQIMRRNITTYKGFVVVHCSAGIGRTGTLIAIDILLQHLRDNRKLDVFGTVYRLRHHRINMVQRESQYAYIYNCIKQVLKNPYFLKTCKPPPVSPIYKDSLKIRKDISNSNVRT